MSDVEITWVDQDDSVLDLSPFELLQATASWSAGRPSGEPWLAVTKPTTHGQGFSAISLSLDAYHRFSNELVRRFAEQCEELLDRCTVEETEEMKRQEIQKGNPGMLWQANQGLLRLLLPARLVDDAKKTIEKLFQQVPNGPVVSSETE